MQSINLADSAGLDTAQLLLHGDFNTGKTFVLGAALADEREYGRAIYLKIGSESGEPTLRNFDLDGVELYQVESLKDLTDLSKDLDKHPAHIICIDSLAMLADMAIDDVTGGERAPGEGRGVDGRSEWGHIKFRFLRPLRRLKNRSNLLLAVCPSSKRENELTGTVRVVPNLVGRQSDDIAGEYPFVGYMTALTMSKTSIKRMIHFEPLPSTLTRCNLRTPITAAIELPNGPAVWATIKDALLKGMS